MNVQILPDRLKAQRKYRKLSQKALALRIGYQKQAISRWECSKKPVKIRNHILPALANALACTPEYLKGDTNSKNEEIQNEEITKKLGLPLDLKHDIQKLLRNYSDEQLLFLYDFLKVIDISNSDQLKLIKRICSAIATVDFSITMIRHPLCDWELFYNSFKNTLNAIEQIRRELAHSFRGGKLPDSIDEALDLCSQAISNDYSSLTEPFQTEKKLKNSLTYLPKKFDYFIDTLDKQSSIDLDAREFFKKTYLDTLNTALDSDIKELFKILHKSI